MSHWQYLASNKASGGYGMVRMKQFLATWLIPGQKGSKQKKDDLVVFTLGSAVVQSASIQRLFIECPQGKAWFSLYRLLPQSTQRHVLLLFSGHSSQKPVLTCLMYRLLAADTEMGMRKSEEIFNIFGDNILNASIVFRLKSMYEYYQ